MEIQKRNGQSLIEIVVAVGIMATVLVGVSSLITRSLSLSTFQANKNMSVNTARNQIDHYSKIRDQSPSDFFLNYGSYTGCVDVPSLVVSCQIVYQRIPPETNVEIDGVKMIVSVSWKEGDETVSTTLSQVLSKPIK